MALEFNNYSVLTATNGKDALNILSESQRLPDLIISDIMMPEIDGYELFKTISTHPLWATIPFIFLSARASPEDVRLGKILGADDYLTKPFNEDDLLAVISGKLTRIKQQNSIRNLIKAKKNYNLKSEIIAASIRTQEHILQCMLEGVDIATIPYKQLTAMTKHPLTDKGIENFIKDYKKINS